MQKAMKIYSQYLKFAKIKLKAKEWIALSIGISTIIFGILLMLILLLQVPIPLILAIVLYIVMLDLSIGYPYLIGTRRIDEIEKNFPSALKQMADTLKAGGTYEFALRELTQSELGALREEFEEALRKLEEGENFEIALKSISADVNSKLVQRTITVIIDSMKSGAGLADVLEEISDDIRDMYRIKVERKGRVIMQVMFMIAAGAAVAPFIFGLVGALLELLLSTTASLQAVTQSELAQTIAIKENLKLLIQLYMSIEVIASAVMISVMQEGKLSKSVLLIPILLLVANIVYFVSTIAMASFFGVLK